MNDVDIRTVAEWLDRRLGVGAFPEDVSNNGLQVEACRRVGKIVCGVDASLALFVRAAALGADLVIVHHGLSWGGNPKRLKGWIGERYGILFRRGISLYACHLPLDAHPELGNNAVLCDRLGLSEREPFFEYDGGKIGFTGMLGEAVQPERLAELFGCGGGALFGAIRPSRRIAVVSGGAGIDALTEAALAGCDLLVTGEMEHVMYHPAHELNIGVLALGHYASETGGVRAAAEAAAEEFGLKWEFIDLPTGL